MSETDRAGDPKRKTPYNLDRLNVYELAALRDAAEAKRLEKLDEAKAALLEEFREKASVLGVSLESMLAGRKRGSTGEKVPVKYRGPKGEEWSGRGRKPQWVQEIETQGKSQKDFLIQKS